MAFANNVIPGHRGGLINVVSWIFMVIMILASTAKIVNKWQRVKGLMLDDYLLIAAAILAVAQTIAINIQVSSGLGDTAPPKDGPHLTTYQRAAYASELFYVCALFAAKATTASFIRFLAPVRWVRLAMLIFAASIALWTVVCMFVLAFQCKLPVPWSLLSQNCINQALFWDIYGTLDIITDTILIVIPVSIVIRLHTNWRDRMSVVTAFSLRLISLPIVILRMVYINASFVPFGYAQNETNAVLFTELQVHMAIIFTCLPFMKAVIEAMQHGVMTSDLVYGPGASQANSNGRTFDAMDYLPRSLQRNSRPLRPTQTGPTEQYMLNEYNTTNPAHAPARRNSVESGTSQSYDKDGRANSRDIEIRTTITTCLETV